MATIAWVSNETPDVAGGGGQRRQFHQIRVLLQRGIGVRVLALEGPQTDDSIRTLAPVTRFPARSRFRRRNPPLERLLRESGADGVIVAHVESLEQAGEAVTRSGLPLLLDFHNVNSRWHQARGEPREAEAWRERERQALRAASLSTACSEEEAGVLLGLAPGAAVELAGHGVAAEEWPADALALERAPAVALFGAWGHGPNRDGARWLVERVWPAVRDRVPEGRLLLVGPGEPPPECVAAPGVEATGRVGSLAQALGGVRVAAVPIVGGIGARVKFGEALASGAAVVSTSEGAEGFDADGAFVRADSPAAFAAACADLLVDDGRAAELGRRGRAVALERLTWERTSAALARWAESVRR